MSRNEMIDYCVTHMGYSWEWYDSLPDNQLYAIYMKAYDEVMDAYYEEQANVVRSANEYDDDQVRTRLVESRVSITSPNDIPKKADGTVDFEALNRMYANN